MKSWVRGRCMVYKLRLAPPSRIEYRWVGIKANGTFGVFKEWREAVEYVQGSHVGFLSFTVPAVYMLGPTVYGCGCHRCDP